MKIVLESTIESISSRVDGTVVIKISTQELNPDAAGKLFQLRGKFAKTLLSDSNITDVEAEIVDSANITNGKKNKTPSQRLRAVLFRLHELNDTGNFETYYNSELDKIITHYKNKLD